MKIEIILTGASGIIGASKEVDSIDNYELSILFKEAWKNSEWDTNSAELWIDNIYVAEQSAINEFGDFSITKYRGIYNLAFDEGNAQLESVNVENLRKVF